MALWTPQSSVEAHIVHLSTLIDRVTLDPDARLKAKLELAQLDRSPELTPGQSKAVSALPEALADDPWTRRARPTFLYVIYAMLLSALPVGIVAAISPATAAAIAAGVRAYLEALPEPLYALFGTGYLGYATLRQWGKAKERER
ncbi:3TM-type holin [Novosphingobium sp. RD2P27]|uniref:3TM-type holin n=1 Tax=Novosphingobium kalidii TaxID=3230299 RepID=A0ABV2CZD1_9SPHN